MSGSRLPVSTQRKIRRRYDRALSIASIGREFDVSREAVIVALFGRARCEKCGRQNCSHRSIRRATPGRPKGSTQPAYVQTAVHGALRDGVSVNAIARQLCLSRDAVRTIRDERS